MKIIVAIILLIGLVDCKGRKKSQRLKSADCECGTTNGTLVKRAQERIVGGVNAKVNEFPMIGAITYTNRPHFIFCGSTVITRRHAVTAAHCYKGPRANLSLVLGEHNTQDENGQTLSIRIKHFIAHEDFDKTGVTENDIALLVLAKRIPFGPTIRPACFPDLGLTGNLIGKKVRVIGWGLLFENGPQPNILQKVDLDVVDTDVCEKHFGGTNEKQICTQTMKKDACQGDSGGPVLFMDPETRRYAVVGVVSYGDGCAQPDVPAISTNVAAYREWILQKISQTDRSSNICPIKKAQ